MGRSRHLALCDVLAAWFLFVVARERGGPLMGALRRLSPNQRAAVVLHYDEGLKTREIAGVLGMSSATVKVHLHRGRKRLRELLGSDEIDDA